MNRLRQFCAAAILLFTLVLPTIAGEIATGIVSRPPSSPESVMGDMATGYADPLTEFGLSILQSLLSLF